MGNNIRIGKDFNVQWAINKVVDGERLPYDLVGKELQLYIVNDNGRKEVAGWKVQGNVIEWTYLGKDQRRLGAYQLVLVENAGKEGMVTVDTCKAFNLVEHSCEENVDGGNGIVIKTVTLESDVALAPVVKEVGGGASEEDIQEIKNDIVDLQLKDVQTDAKLTELSAEVSEVSEEINGNSIQTIKVEKGVSVSTSQRHPLELKSGNVNVTFVDTDNVISVSYVSLYFYNAEGVLVKQMGIGEVATPFVLDADVAEYGLYIPDNQVAASGEFNLIFGGNGVKLPIREDLESKYNELHEAIHGGFLLTSSVSGWKASPILYIDYVYKNSATYGSGIRVKDENGSQVFYKTFPVSEKRAGIEKIVEHKDGAIISIVVNWDYYDDGFNKVLLEPIYLPKLSFFSDSSQSLANEQAIDELRKEASKTKADRIGLSLPNTIYAIVGDTLQIFYRGLMSVVNPYQYDILVSCNKGKQYPRYFEYTPTLADVGETTFKISVKNSNGDILETKSCKLITSGVPSSVSNLNIACFGDSLTDSGVWCAEAFRRLTKTDGNPAGIGLSNINFVGKEKAANGAGYYGEGGWRWNHYVTAGARAFRFYVTNVNLLSIGSQYSNNGSTFTIKEINVTEGNGNILCSVVGANNPQTSGVLTLVSGNGDGSISYASYNLVPTNPLWDSTNNKMSFVPYVTEYAQGKLDVAYVLLGWNEVHRESYPYPSMMADCKTFIDTLHSEFPNAKVKLMGLQVCSINGGMGANYGATGSAYADTFGTIRKLMDLNQAYKDFAESSAYSSFVEYVDIASQFDSENNMPSAETKVNTRSSMTERRGTNGVHPSTDGYMQIADVVYRNIIANL